MNLTETGQVRQSNLWARQALAQLESEGVEPTPNNYAVYYHYLMGDIPALIAAYNALKAQGKIAQADYDELHTKYIADTPEAEFLKDASSLIDNELRKVLGLLDMSLQGTDRFGENLAHFSDKLNNVPSLDDLRDTVDKIVEETHQISQQNAQLREELSATSQQLAATRNDFDRIHRESQTDPLTDIGNRKFFDREIAGAIAEANTNADPQTGSTLLSLLMVDIDHFKRFNDTHGHLIGDQVLRLVAQTFVENLKGRDIIARYGGEEFVILLPQTRVQDAVRVADHLRASLASKQIKKRGSNEVLGAITISLGAAQYQAGEDKDSFIGRADAALYKAKQTGRNKVVCADAAPL